MSSYFDVFDFPSPPQQISSTPPSAAPAKALPAEDLSSTSHRVGLDILVPTDSSPEWDYPQPLESLGSLQKRFVSQPPKSSFVDVSLDSSPPISLKQKKAPLKEISSDEDLFQLAPVPKKVQPPISFLRMELDNHKKKEEQEAIFSQQERAQFQPRRGAFGEGFRRSQGAVLNLKDLS